MDVEESLLDYTIQDIFRQYPETLGLFAANNLRLQTTEEVSQDFGAILRLKTVLMAKGIDIKEFSRLLRDTIKEANRYQRTVITEKKEEASLSFVAQLPSLLKDNLESELQAFFEKMRQEKKRVPNFYTELCCNAAFDFNECVPYISDIDEMPDLVLSKGYEFFNSSFVEQFIRTGYFASIAGRQVDSKMEDFGIIETGGVLNSIAVEPIVMVVDHKHLNGLPLPRRWSDLLKTEYERKVEINSNDNSFSETVLLNIYKEYGNTGIAALGRSVRHSFLSGANSSLRQKAVQDSPPIYVMSLFFANKLIASENFEIVWPEDGAIAMPLYFLVKTEKANELKDFIGFLSGPAIGKMLSNAQFPSVHPDVDNRLPEGAAFCWHGWDILMKNDVGKLFNRVKRQFLASYHRYLLPRTISLVRGMNNGMRKA
jgi:ABC-type Fe3+ transport system substrate-binding protein